MQEKKVSAVVWLCCLWVLTLLYGEMVAFWIRPLWTCSWPQLPNQTMNQVAHGSDFVKIAVLTDTLLMDKTSLRLPPKSLALEIVQFYTDIFMRRAFTQSVLPFKPDMILFLGDYFDGGPFLSDEEWQESLDRFKHIFNLEPTRRSLEIPVHYLPGNHDIGYGIMHSRNPKVISRYEKDFGARNYQFSVGSLEFVAVDSQTLDGKKNGNLTSASWDFVKNISIDGTSGPRVLLTHIPLYRPDWTPCGLQRSSPVINQRILRYDQEIRYQNYLSEESSSLLLDSLRPVLVLSGHDHDQCTVTHQTRHGSVKEHTLGSLSWQQGNLYPSFMLLSASKHAFSNTTSPKDAVSSHLCFLPMQTHIYMWYLSLFACTVLLLLFRPMIGLGSWNYYMGFLGTIGRSLISIIKSDGTKEKDEDEICDYEMIWDAEGSMHLVKKAVKKPESTCSIASRTVGRNVPRTKGFNQNELISIFFTRLLPNKQQEASSARARRLLPNKLNEEEQNGKNLSCNKLGAKKSKLAKLSSSSTKHMVHQSRAVRILNNMWTIDFYGKHFKSTLHP